MLTSTNSARVELNLERPRRYLAVLPSNLRPSLFSGD